MSELTRSAVIAVSHGFAGGAIMSFVGAPKWGIAAVVFLATSIVLWGRRW